ncbi:MAG: hypothetical protein ABIH21_04380 [Patescibacteria group bacterium]
MAQRSYDYKAKNAVRDMFLGFMPPQFPAGSTGLYLPGRENLELPGFVKKGILPVNLIGAEHDSETFAQIASVNSGIRLYLGDLRKAVDMAEQLHFSRFVFASLDFDGSYHTDLEDLLSVFRIFPGSPDGYMSVTSYVARDRGTVSQGVANILKFLSAIEDPSEFYSDYGSMLRRHDAFMRFFHSKASSARQLAWELGLLWWVVIGLSVTEIQNDGLYGRLDSGFLKRLNVPLSRIEAMAKKCSAESFFVASSDSRLGKLLEERRCQYRVQAFQHFAYRTQSGQPMRTWLFYFREADPQDQPTAREVLEDVWRLALRQPLVFLDKNGVKITFE